ncbi:MAG: asparagine synthase (glutamine-hydrolyzing), partial [Bacteroidales bacterium]|nr:asparagine synthase (glutamine-hydrolyzing) [Bacteroidales bacterium]
MCGIVGFYSKNDKFVSKEELSSMTESLVHRGPDASGMYFTPTVGLGHRRLSIIDLSSDAHQPMESHTMRYACVFNGEIYNYKTIAQELGLDFKTNSDTEVVLEAFAEWGVTFVNKLNGMFSIVIYDKQEKVIYLFRDRIGVKPLYYYWDGRNFAFASEIKALLRIKHIRNNRQIDQQSVLDYLHLGYIPEPNSIYKNIFKFPAGNMGIVSSSGFRIESYWHIEGVIRRRLIEDELECKTKLKSLIESSVSMRLIGDISYGTLLSGGVDSSLVTAVAAKMSGQTINTFSIGIKDSKVDESGYARNVAKYLNTNHNELMLNEIDARNMIVDMLDYFDEPFGDSSAIPTMLASKFAREQVGMVLSGDGGDELFHGYGSYKWARRLSYTSNRTLRRFLSFALTKTGMNKYKRAAHLFQYKQQKHLKSHIFSQEQYFFSIQEINKLMLQETYLNTTVDQDFSYFIRKLTPAED